MSGTQLVYAATGLDVMPEIACTSLCVFCGTEIAYGATSGRKDGDRRERADWYWKLGRLGLETG
eukprot:867500-Rhodomonas_salina.1